MATGPSSGATGAMTGNGRGVALVVDDDLAFAAVLGEYLTLCGFDVRQAAHGLEALLQIKRERPRLVLLDLHMPRLGGLDALRRIRAFDSRVEVVVITGDPDPEIERQALALGATRVLLKPMDLADFGHALGLPGLGADPPSPPAH